jgi:anti-sigma regulatory factor (Ser/Thr protein kinase)
VDPVLITDWLDGAEPILVLDEASVSVVRDEVRAAGGRVGLPAETTARLVNVASELARNQLAHALGGRIAVVPVERAGVQGIEVVAADRGSGIRDPARALPGGHSTAGTLGVGLAAVRELAPELDIDVRHGEGTCVRARAFLAEVPRSREVGVFARAYPGEVVSGDGAFVRRTPRGLLVMVVDGLGHGEEARAATIAAIAAARVAAERGPAALLAACHLAAARTRGVAMTVAEVTERGELTLAGVGNVMAYVVGPGVALRFTGAPGVVGAPGPLRKVATETTTLGPYDALLLFSDGVSTRVALENDVGFLREAPIVIAQRTMERFGRDNDDATVLVAR